MPVKCACCGEARATLVALQSRDDIALCRECVGWLRTRMGVPDVTPIFPITDMTRSTKFYESAGFEVRHYDGGYGFVSLDGQSVFDLDLWDGKLNVEANLAGCALIVPDVDEWHERLVAAGANVTNVEDKPWGMREFTLTDPDRNYLRISRSI